MIAGKGVMVGTGVSAGNPPCVTTWVGAMVLTGVARSVDVGV